jgi:hypothetical protein
MGLVVGISGESPSLACINTGILTLGIKDKAINWQMGKWRAI